MRAAHELVAQEGFAGAKVAAVAGVCGVSAGSLYSYFGSRDELLARVFRRAADAGRASLGPMRSWTCTGPCPTG
ncbi:TetR/AcrR family transcriptional regulator, partial [Streptomyces murinus]|uniref:TetR/AcrR family transcriptional regulator n=1 Tax=Streptomyces murinus TaxID=33900 RepID=UPI003F44E796